MVEAPWSVVLGGGGPPQHTDNTGFWVLSDAGGRQLLCVGVNFRAAQMFGWFVGTVGTWMSLKRHTQTNLLRSKPPHAPSAPDPTVTCKPVAGSRAWQGRQPPRGAGWAAAARSGVLETAG